MRYAFIGLIAVALSACGAWPSDDDNAPIQPSRYEVVPLGPSSWVQIRVENSQVRYCEGSTSSVRCSPYIDANVASAVQSGREVFWERYPFIETISPQDE